MTKGNPLPALLRAFFQEWLAEQRSASIHTIRSYRDTWRLLLRFVAERKGGGVARLTLTDVSAGEVRAFLHHTEHGRNASNDTWNDATPYGYATTRMETTVNYIEHRARVPIEK